MISRCTVREIRRRTRDPWETLQIRDPLSSLIDARSRTQTYNVDPTEAKEAPSQAKNVPVANRSRISTTVCQQVS